MNEKQINRLNNFLEENKRCAYHFALLSQIPLSTEQEESHAKLSDSYSELIFKIQSFMNSVERDYYIYIAEAEQQRIIEDCFAQAEQGLAAIEKIVAEMEEEHRQIMEELANDE